MILKTCKRCKDIRWRDLLIAFVMAVTTWFMVNGQEKVDTWVEVRVDFKGIPSGLTVSSGLINKVSVRVRGTRGLLSTMNFQEYYLTVDLRGIAKGTNVIPIDTASLPFSGALEVVEVNPSNIELTVDAKISEERKVVLGMEGELPEDMEVGDVTLTPEVVTLRGPESVLADMENVKVMVQVGSLKKIGPVTLTGVPLLPSNVESIPPQVNIKMTMRRITKNITLQRKATLILPPHVEGKITNGNVKIELRVPKSLATSPELANVKAKLEPTDVVAMAVGGSLAVDVQVDAPEWAEVIKVTPEKIFVNIHNVHKVDMSDTLSQ